MSKKCEEIPENVHKMDILLQNLSDILKGKIESRNLELLKYNCRNYFGHYNDLDFIIELTYDINNYLKTGKVSISG
jgi:hypothetical protein